MLSYSRRSTKRSNDAKIRHGFKVYEKESPLIFKCIMQKFIWSPIIWQAGIRAEKNFSFSYYAALDFENPEVSIDNIQKSFCDSWHILGTTRNHQKVKGDDPAIDRFRLLLKWEEPIFCIRQYRSNVRRLAARYGADLACIDGARLFFPCKEIVSSDTNGYLEEVWATPDEEDIEQRREAYLRYAAKNNRIGLMSSYAMRWLANEIPYHQRNNTCLRLGCDLYRAGIEYEECLRRILASPTYQGREISDSLLNEIQRAVSNGYRLAARET